MTDNMQYALTLTAAALPTVTALVGILINRQDANRLENRINLVESSLRAEMKDLRQEIKDVRQEVKDVRQDLNVFRTQVHGDILTLVNLINDQDKRVTRLERA